MGRRSGLPTRRRRGRHRRDRIRQAVRISARRVLERSLSFCAFAFVALLLLAMTMPAFAPQSAEARDAASTQGLADDPQSLALPSHDLVPPVARDTYSVTSRAELLRQRFTLTYSTTWTGAIRWPFPVAVPISDGYGNRPAPCAGCSTYHTALDFDAGSGTPIYAIADGVVAVHDDGRGAFGNYVVIEHQINGQTVYSTYAHMQRASSPLVVGQTISVGDYIGLVGATGRVSGPHLHLEIEVDGQTIDPFKWLTDNAG